jgi:hypothetical protein
MESQLQRQKESMKGKIPEIKRALEIIEFLEKKQGKEFSGRKEHLIICFCGSIFSLIIE